MRMSKDKVKDALSIYNVTIAASDAVDLKSFRALVDAGLILEKARSCVRAVNRDFDDDRRMTRGYLGLLRYLATTILLLVVVCGQRGLRDDRTSTYQAIQGQMFATMTDIVGSDVTIRSSVTTVDAVVSWMTTNVLDPIFTAEVCGDGVCQAPEEQPDFVQTSDNSVRRFASIGCAADCGTAATRRVRISFVDPWKLYFAAKHMTAAVDHGWAGRTAATWGASDRYPAAGWNLCAVNHTEYGAFTDVCLFDGDIVVEGLPFRTNELDLSGGNFGGSIELDLFEAQWELRLAYVNFSWPSLADAPDLTPPKAFPAVRAEICLTEDKGVWIDCHYTAPCPDTEDCRCEFYQSEYFCFDGDDPEHASWWNQWDPKFYEFALQHGKQWLGRWWGINITNTTTFAEFQAAFEANNTAALDDDGWLVWDSCNELYHVVISDPNYDFRRSDDEITIAVSILEDANGVYVIEDVGPTAEETVVDLYLCDELSYTLSVTPDCSRFSDDLEWSLVHSSTEEIIHYGGPSVSECALFTSSSAASSNSTTTAECASDDEAYDGFCSRVGPQRRRRLLQPGGGPGGGGGGGGPPGTRPPSITPAPSTSAPSTVPPTAVPSFTFRPTPQPSAVPTSYPTSLDNLFNKNLRTIADDDHFYLTLDACQPLTVDDGVCDTVNDNAACGWDGSDCCKAVCTDCDVTSTDCLSPVEVGATNADGDTCVFDYSDDDDDYFEEEEECTPMWPFSVTFSHGDWHLKMPFMAYGSFRDILRARNNFEEIGHDWMPSIMCGDCDLAHLAGAYASHRFGVAIFEDSNNNNATSSAYPLFDPDVRLRRLRSFPTIPNLVLAGPMLTTTRYGSEDCKAGVTALFRDPDDYAATCLHDQKKKGIFMSKKGKANRYDRSPYGQDATYMESSSLYRATNDPGDFYDVATEVNERGLPYGFFPSQRRSESSTIDFFPLVFDVNLNVTRYQDLLTLMADGAYIDDQTRKLTLSLAVFNTETADVAFVEAQAVRIDGGGFSFDWDIGVFDVLLYDTTEDWLRCVGELLYAGFLLFSIAIEMKQMRDVTKRTGSLRAYVTDWTNAVDLGSYATQTALVMCWIIYAQRCAKLRLVSHVDNIYSNFFATARIVDAGDGLAKVVDLYNDLRAVADAGRVYRTVVAATFFVSMVQFLKSLHFHHKLGLTTSTIFTAGRDLLFFAFLFLFILMLYGVLGMLLFGTEVPAFRTFGLSLMSLIDFVFGDFDSVSERKIVDQDPFIIVFFYSYVVVSGVILLNALLAIIVDAYTTVKEKSNKKSKEVIGKLLRQWCFFFFDTTPPKPDFIPDDQIIAFLTSVLLGGGGGEDIQQQQHQRHHVSSRVLLLTIGNSTVALDQPMLVEAITLAGASSLSSDLVCYNVLERQGVLPGSNAIAPTPDEEEAIALYKDVMHFSKIRPTDTLTQLAISLSLAASDEESDRAPDSAMDDLVDTIADIDDNLYSTQRKLDKLLLSLHHEHGTGFEESTSDEARVPAAALRRRSFETSPRRTRRASKEEAQLPSSFDAAAPSSAPVDEESCVVVSAVIDDDK